MTNFLKWFESIIFSLVLWILRIVPVKISSNCTGSIAEIFGPMTKRHKIAMENIDIAFPKISKTEKDTIIKGMWNNLGRTIGELAHLNDFDCYNNNFVEIIGVEYLDYFRDDGIGGIAFSAHLGWWDLTALAINQRGLDAEMVFRAENNIYFKNKSQKARSVAGKYLEKGPKTAKKMLRGLQEGKHYGMLLDQKMNDGISVPFFGRPAMTASAAAEFAIRNKIPLLPVRCERLGGVKFRITFYPPLDISSTGERKKDVFILTSKINIMLENWIRERPEQWLWIHRRWPDN